VSYTCLFDPDNDSETYFKLISNYSDTQRPRTIRYELSLAINSVTSSKWSAVAVAAEDWAQLNVVFYWNVDGLDLTSGKQIVLILAIF
jgi:hypothetical protein